MVIGRSGTGKTTCAILRLFSIHILLKYKVQLHNLKSNKLFHLVIQPKIYPKESDLDFKILGHCYCQVMIQIQQIIKNFNVIN